MKVEETAQKKGLRLRKIALTAAAVLALYLGMESFLPPSRQPSAYALAGVIHAYQATISPRLGKVVHCKFEPTCSHYGEESIAKYGTLKGTFCTMGRLWRCSSWGPPPGKDLP